MYMVSSLYVQRGSLGGTCDGPAGCISFNHSSDKQCHASNHSLIAGLSCMDTAGKFAFSIAPG